MASSFYKGQSPRESTYELCDFVLKVVVQNLTCLYEKVFDILARHGRGLEGVEDALLLLELFYTFMADFAFVLHVKFVAHQEQDDLGLALVHHFVVPRRQVVESFQTRDVVRQEDAVRPTVKYFGDRFERLLACRVPDLQLEHLLLQFHEQSAELHAYCDFVISEELVVGEPVQDTRLPHCRVANDDELEEEVLVLHGFVLQDLVGHLFETLQHLLSVFGAVHHAYN